MDSVDLNLALRLRSCKISACETNTPRIPIATLARVSGLSRRTLYNAMRGKVRPATRATLILLLDGVGRGEFGFGRQDRQWRIVGAAPIVPQKKRPSDRHDISETVHLNSVPPLRRGR